jgi:hypothetical protein
MQMRGFIACLGTSAASDVFSSSVIIQSLPVRHSRFQQAKYDLDFGRRDAGYARFSLQPCWQVRGDDNIDVTGSSRSLMSATLWRLAAVNIYPSYSDI